MLCKMQLRFLLHKHQAVSLPGPNHIRPREGHLEPKLLPQETPSSPTPSITPSSYTPHTSHHLLTSSLHLTCCSHLPCTSSHPFQTLFIPPHTSSHPHTFLIHTTYLLTSFYTLLTPPHPTHISITSLPILTPIILTPLPTPPYTSSHPPHTLLTPSTYILTLPHTPLTSSSHLTPSSHLNFTSHLLIPSSHPTHTSLHLHTPFPHLLTPHFTLSLTLLTPVTYVILGTVLYPGQPLPASSEGGNGIPGLL